MKILWLTTTFPYPPNSGLKTRDFNLIRSMAARHDVTLVSFVQESNTSGDVAFMRSLCREVHTVASTTRSGDEIDPRWRHAPYYMASEFSPEMEATVQGVLAQESFDAIVASKIHAAPYVPGDFSGVKVFDSQDVATMQWRGAMKQKRGLKTKLWYWREFFKLRRYEIALVRCFDLCPVVSRRDQRIFQRWAPHVPAPLLPVSLELSEYAPFLHTPKEEHLISFCGTFNFTANVYALMWFYHKVYPQVRRAVPDVRLMIVGRRPPAAVQALCNDESVSGFWDVEDVKPYLARSVVSVAPMHIDSGVNVKCLVEMALGVPVVTTTIGWRGLEATPEKDLLVGRSPAAFARQVVRLLRDASLRERIAQNALEIIRTRYANDVVTAQFEEELVRCAEAKLHVRTFAR
ncbi:MAG: glycosyltransferase family 4 protein [Abditibacteriales bacterium]|nr:glycosyltransferase family 4 protein [Abditibacteriales bacterium]